MKLQNEILIKLGIQIKNRNIFLHFFQLLKSLFTNHKHSFVQHMTQITEQNVRSVLNNFLKDLIGNHS